MVHNSKPVSLCSSKGPQTGKKMVQQYFSIYFQRPGGCLFADVLFVNTDCDILPEWEEEWRNGRTDDPQTTMSDNVRSFMNDLIVTLIGVSLSWCFT